MECTKCPYYEDHWGTYYQGCWEFYDICWVAQDLGTPSNCYSNCFMIQEDEAAMLNVCLGALDKKREIKCHDGSSIEGDLTVLEKSYIIKDMETFMKIFNEIKDPTSYYKQRGRKNIGTNYYWYREAQWEGPKEEGLHIGKRSCGWAFNFEAHYDKFQRYKLTSYHAWKEFLKEGFIYDEYGEFIPYEKFIKLVEATRPKGKTFKDIPEAEQIHLCDEWVDAGFMFTLGDFC